MVPIEGAAKTEDSAGDRSKIIGFKGVVKTTTTVAHLLGQPLTVITGYVDLLSASTEEENTKEKLSIMKSQLDLISKYLHDLRNLKEYKTVDFAGVTLLDIDPSDTNKE